MTANEVTPKLKGLIIENIHTPVQNQDKLWSDNPDGEDLAECYMQCVKDCAEESGLRPCGILL
ncbi:hypothetical protein [Murimonas intestini]|uniref:hypothetical protein n=1 Tax=Murimonas intestini TaxID=1337051 RepID=UPI00214CF89C|nr:hypothetical protein [Murimonas intestini]MCR1841013.1 hypothetical protein [Murimonas intestini]MCR1865869.1 hypothetical protein [Murimonas intestini]MCR1883289.1 hypothetical protein [Murimonas intestini]